MHDDQVRYSTHKFEFTNREFIAWCSELSERYGYDVSHGGVGDAPKDFKAGVQSSLWAYFVYNEKKYLAKKTFGRFSRVLEKLIYEWPIVKFAMAHDTGGFNNAQNDTVCATTETRQYVQACVGIAGVTGWSTTSENVFSIINNIKLCC